MIGVQCIFWYVRISKDFWDLMNSFNRHNCLEYMWENFWNSRIRHAPFCSLSMTSSKRVTQIWEPPVHLHKHDVLKRQQEGRRGANKRIELLMAHGQRHTAIAKQIQKQIENRLETLHAETQPPPVQWRFDGASVRTVLDFPTRMLEWEQGAQVSFRPRKISALVPEWCPSCSYTIYSGCCVIYGTFYFLALMEDVQGLRRHKWWPCWGWGAVICPLHLWPALLPLPCLLWCKKSYNLKKFINYLHFECIIIFLSHAFPAPLLQRSSVARFWPQASSPQLTERAEWLLISLGPQLP